MPIDLLYFAWVRERIGRDGEQVEPPGDVRDVAGLVDWLATRDEAARDALSDRTRLRAAIDGRMAALAEPIAGAREIAIFPPVTGG